MINSKQVEAGLNRLQQRFYLLPSQSAGLLCPEIFSCHKSASKIISNPL